MNTSDFACSLRFSALHLCGNRSQAIALFLSFTYYKDMPDISLYGLSDITAERDDKLKDADGEINNKFELG